MMKSAPGTLAAASAWSALLFCLVMTPLCAEPICEWLIWGPYAGMAGLSVLEPDMERRIRPADGDVTEAWSVSHATKTTWRPFLSSSARVDMNMPETFAGRPEIMAWCGGCAYAHAYLHVDSEQPV
ncbi:MAG: hypothetical protein V2A77_04660, partial [Pseudomonadota bacterium]